MPLGLGLYLTAYDSGLLQMPACLDNTVEEQIGLSQVCQSLDQLESEILVDLEEQLSVA